MFSIATVRQANKVILEQEGLGSAHKLRDYSLLAGRLKQAEKIIGHSPTDKSVLLASASLLYGIAYVQAFRDGNKRTALFVTHNLLAQYSLQDILQVEADNDYQVWRMLNRLVNNNTGQEADFFKLLEKRFLNKY
jgi:prophage maintenance system killer protein